MSASNSAMTKGALDTTSKSNPFAPSSSTVNTSSASQSARPVTLPHIPELYAPITQILDSLIPKITFKPSEPGKVDSTESADASNPFMDGLRETANRTTTYNDAAAYKSTLSPTLDAFASLSQNTRLDDIPSLLTKSWDADPKLTLQIIWNLRSIHEGKSAREPFYRAFGWLYLNHPGTAVANLKYLVEPCVKRTIKKKAKAEQVDEDMAVITKDDLAEIAMEEDPPQDVSIAMPHGYWKDLLNILLLATRDQLTPISSLSALHVRMKSTKEDESAMGIESNGSSTLVNEPPASGTDDAADLSEKRLKKHQDWNKNVSQKLAVDKVYRALYVTVARLFADGLARDIGILRQIADEKTDAEQRISLAFDLTLVGKWAPSIGGSHDRVTNIATAIAELLYVGGHLPLPDAPLEQPLSQEVAHKLRSAYTRWALSPLRRFLQVPEIAMSARQWNKIKYTRVPSKCMQVNKTHFFRHDEERFSQYLLDVAKGKKKISGATLLPHELLAEAMALDPGLAGTRSPRDVADAKIAAMQAGVVDAQWKSMIARVKESGALGNAIAVCDVSGSMGYLGNSTSKGIVTPIFPAVALSIVLSQTASLPWANTFITFSEQPELVSLQPDQGLASVATYMNETSWGMNTDFNAVFTKLILPTAVENKLKPEDMIKRLFVFSDMQFDDSRKPRSPKDSSDVTWETEHQIIKQKFAEAGYEMPEIVYWNLAGDLAKPVTKDEEGVALVSGFSPGMLKIFLDQGSPDVEEGDIKVVTKQDESGEYEEVIKPEKKRLDPVDTMLKALGKESFSGLEVYD